MHSLMMGLWLLTSVAGAQEWTPSADEQAIWKALSLRDPAPSCATVEALSAEPARALKNVAENATMPPWAGMRAADCLVSRHALAEQVTLASWAKDPAKQGLARLVVGRIDALPEPVALAVARSGLEGPHAAVLRPKIAASVLPNVAVLATPVP